MLSFYLTHEHRFKMSQNTELFFPGTGKAGKSNVLWIFPLLWYTFLQSPVEAKCKVFIFARGKLYTDSAS